MMMKTTVMNLMIGSTTNCLTRTNAPTSMAFIVVVSTVPIIVPFGTFMARLTDISRDTTIIQGLVITAMAMAIGVINSVSGWGCLAPQSDNLAILRCGLSYKKGTEMSRNTMTTGTLAVLTISLLATSANAHPKLISASPAADVSSKVSPTEIKLNFNEGVIAKFSGVEIKNESGKAIPTGVPLTDPKDQKQLVVPLPAPLMAGHYTVTWHAVSEDTHRVKGEYSFGVDR
jgi:methionine-rich copper-binding protein CopC